MYNISRKTRGNINPELTFVSILKMVWKRKLLINTLIIESSASKPFSYEKNHYLIIS